MKEWFKKVFTSSSVPYIWKWSKKQHIFILITSILNILIAGLSIYFSLVTKAIVDSAVDGNTEGIIRNAIILAVILLIQILCSYAISRLNLYVKAKMQMNMRREVLDQILKKEYKDISRFHSGELVNRMFSDVNTVIDGVTSIIPPLLCMLTQLIGAIIVLAKLDWRFVVVLCLVGIIALVMTLLFKGKMKSMHKDVQSKEGKVHASLQETIENSMLIKASGTEDHMEEVVDENQKTFFTAQINRNRFTSVASSGLRVMFNASWLFAIVWGCVGIANHAYSYGTLMAIMQLVGQIQSPFRNLSGTLQQIYGTISSAERLLDIFSLPDEISEEEKDVKAPEYSDIEKLVVDNVSFSYNRDKEVLNDISVSFSKGEIVAFTGLSGGGKSTLFLLMLGIYRPTKGKIYFSENGKEHIVSKNTRELFAYVPQGNSLFSGTLRDNLLMFNDKAKDDMLLSCCETACIREFIDSLENGLDTVIGERGIGLSEGQAQRIAIARALVSGAPYLLFDESTSALDEETEANLLKNIEKLHNKTCFIVTHRKAALKICNRRVHIENHRMTEYTE